MKSQDEVNKALQTSLAKEVVLRQKVQDLERSLQQAQEDHQKEKEARDTELQKIRGMNEELIRDKDRIMQQHIQEAYQANMHLHARST